MNNIFIGLDGFLYLSKDVVSYNKFIDIRYELSNIEPYSGNSKYKKTVINIYNERNNYMILPRYYGIELLSDHKIKLKKKMIVLENGSGIKRYELKAKLRQYQLDAVKTIKNKYRDGSFGGILKLPTGSGKTLTSLQISNVIGLKTLIVVNNKSLARQWISEVNKFYSGRSTCILSNYRKKDDGVMKMKVSDITVCVRNTLIMNKYSWKDFREIGFVIIDEVHTVISEKVLKIFNRISRRFILGVTATPKKLNNLDFINKYYIGPILYSYNKSYEGMFPYVYFVNYKSEDPMYNKILKLRGQHRGFNTRSCPRRDLLTNKIGPRKISGIGADTNIDFTRTNINIMSDPKRIKLVCLMIKKCISDDKETKRMIVMAPFRKTLEKIYTNTSLNKYQDIMGIFYSVSNKKDLIKQQETLKNKRIILAITSLGKESLNIKECNRLILTDCPIIHKDINDNWNTSQMDQIVGRTLRKNWNIRPKIYIINTMFSFFIGHMKKRKIYFEDIKKWKLIMLSQSEYFNSIT